MSGSNRNFVLAYVFLVILPLLGLAGILKAGRNVTAPVSIDGLWTMRIDSTQIDSLPCGKALATLPDKTVAITQLGRNFVLTFPNGPRLTASGALDGDNLRADLMGTANSFDSGCVAGRQMLLLASVDRKVGSNLLTGTLSVPNCQSCAPVEFRAERQAPAATQGDH